jgi:hypothetical protein
MEIHRFGIKVFAHDPGSISTISFIPILHGWIQKQALENHLLIDLHNYSHIHQGPGILLVAQEGNFSIDSAGGKLGLLYYRKQPGYGAPQDHLASIVRSALQACSLLEAEPALNGRLRFRTDELHIIANDRLLAPNDDATLAELKPIVLSVFERLLKRADFSISRISRDPRERFAVRVQTNQAADVKTLLSRLP